MGYDLDPLDELFADEAAKKARPVGKFQPKPKFRPQRKDTAKTSIASSHAAQTTDSAPTKLSEPIKNAKPLEQSSNVVPSDNADLHAVTEKPVGENADVLFTGLEALGDVLAQTTNDKECSVPPSAAVALNVPNSENIGGSNETPVLSSVEDSTHACKVADVPTDPGLSGEVDTISAGEPIVSSADVHDDMHDTELGREEMDVMDSINTTELTAKSGQRTRKFQPKPKLQMQKMIQVSESVSESLGWQSIPPEIDYSEKDSVPTFQQDDVLDLSSLGFTHTLPTEGTSELPSNEESMNLMEVAQLDSSIHLEDLPEIPAKLASRRAKTGSSKTHAASDPSPQKQKASISSQENGTGRLLRPRKGKTNFCELVDEDRDEVLATGENSEECPLSSPMEEENINSEEIQGESESQKKKLKRKSKKTDDGKEKPAKKSKKSNEASNQDSTKHKKFSHSTRRRRVDKILLETPEDEIDYQKVPFRDLILLAEHRERQEKREKEAVGVPATNQSTGNSSGLYNDENFTSEQGGEYNDGQTPMVDTTEYFNYQSHMDKTPRTRWSKQDTELFYEAIRQFGTDLSMIQLRFPDRSRREVKLKYKKEERQHPLRLHEALTNRSKDRSQFEIVMEHLKKIAAEENQNADKDDSIDLTGNGGADEGTSNADDDEAKDEHIEEEENENVANGYTEVESHLKSDDDEEEEDLLRWSQYKSDI